jgi:hypothetical protein
MSATPWNLETHYRIERSQVPVSADGYKLGEPKRLVCGECGTSVTLDPDPATPGIDDLSHAADCAQRWAKSEWWREHL